MAWVNPQTWRKIAACRDADPSVFFIPTDNGRGRRRGAKSLAEEEALRYCNRCRVREDCLEFALRSFHNNTDPGIWGGTTSEERRKIRKQRRKSRGLIV